MGVITHGCASRPVILGVTHRHNRYMLSCLVPSSLRSATFARMPDQGCVDIGSDANVDVQCQVVAVNTFSGDPIRPFTQLSCMDLLDAN